MLPPRPRNSHKGTFGSAGIVGGDRGMTGAALLAFGTPLAGAVSSLHLSATSDLVAAAANLFSHLRALDAAGAETIAVMPVPNDGLGEAINDRLARAAAPRES